MADDPRDDIIQDQNERIGKVSQILSTIGGDLKQGYESTRDNLKKLPGVLATGAKLRFISGLKPSPLELAAIGGVKYLMGVRKRVNENRNAPPVPGDDSESTISDDNTGRSRPSIPTADNDDDDLLRSEDIADRRLGDDFGDDEYEGSELNNTLLQEISDKLDALERIESTLKSSEEVQLETYSTSDKILDVLKGDPLQEYEDRREARREQQQLLTASAAGATTGAAGTPAGAMAAAGGGGLGFLGDVAAGAAAGSLAGSTIGKLRNGFASVFRAVLPIFPALLGPYLLPILATAGLGAAAYKLFDWVTENVDEEMQETRKRALAPVAAADAPLPKTPEEMKNELQTLADQIVDIQKSIIDSAARTGNLEYLGLPGMEPEDIELDAAQTAVRARQEALQNAIDEAEQRRKETQNINERLQQESQGLTAERYELTQREMGEAPIRPDEIMPRPGQSLEDFQMEQYGVVHRYERAVGAHAMHNLPVVERIDTPTTPTPEPVTGGEPPPIITIPPSTSTDIGDDRITSAAELVRRSENGTLTQEAFTTFMNENPDYIRAGVEQQRETGPYGNVGFETVLDDFASKFNVLTTIDSGIRVRTPFLKSIMLDSLRQDNINRSNGRPPIVLDPFTVTPEDVPLSSRLNLSRQVESQSTADAANNMMQNNNSIAAAGNTAPAAMNGDNMVFVTNNNNRSQSIVAPQTKAGRSTPMSADIFYS